MPASLAPTTESAGRQVAGLTAHGMEVQRFLVANQSNLEITWQLVLSVRTVERHGANLYAKIGAHRRADAIAYAFRYRRIEPAPGPESPRQPGQGPPPRFRDVLLPKIRRSPDGSNLPAA